MQHIIETLYPQRNAQLADKAEDLLLTYTNFSDTATLLAALTVQANGDQNAVQNAASTRMLKEAENLLLQALQIYKKVAEVED